MQLPYFDAVWFNDDIRIFVKRNRLEVIRMLLFWIPRRYVEQVFEPSVEKIANIADLDVPSGDRFVVPECRALPKVEKSVPKDYAH